MAPYNPFLYGFDEADENGDEHLNLEVLYNRFQNKQLTIKDKKMSIVKRIFQSKEDKAMENFGLGTSKELNDGGREEFIDFIYETGSTDRKEFLKRIVELDKSEK